MSKRILITDGMNKGTIEELRRIGYDVVEKFYGDDASLSAALQDAECIVVRSATKVREKHITEALKTKKLKLVIRGGVGVDNIDKEFAEKNGIKVMNTPGASAASVAELALAHMFALARFIGDAKVTMSAGKWEKKVYNGIELAGKTVGIIGMGRIGQELAQRCHALGMKVKYFDVRKDLELPGIYERTDMNCLLGTCDFVSLHIPIKKGEPAVIGSKEIDIMKKGAYIINCARGGVVDEAALIAALNAGKLAGAGVDVFVEEPTKNIELASHPKVTVTPHIGAQTNEGQERVGDEVLGIIEKFFNPGSSKCPR
jgi:D-3-phosphoglycerate dehydrogenase / 2-oxoglutarate reductase